MKMKLFLGTVLWAAITLSPARAQDDDLSRYVTPKAVPVRVLEVRSSFEGLTEKEKLYAHWMSVASWRGALICFEQVSNESPTILQLILGIYSTNPVDLRKQANRRGVSDADLLELERYSAMFLSNTGNYLSFGDTKFVPRISPQKVAIIVDIAASLAGDGGPELRDLWTACRYPMWSLQPDERALGLAEEGTSSYYGEDLTKAEVQDVQKRMQAQGMEAWNTRLFKEDGKLVLWVASVRQREALLDNDLTKPVIVRYGDYSAILAGVVNAFEMAYHYAANSREREMIKDYIDHFVSGDINKHKDAMRAWVKDKGPVVETNIGFIETYRDPIHVRAEWEGLVAIVNKAQSAKFQKLVNTAGKFLPKLPWPKSFEHDVFKRPDFTSLEVLCFANGGIPAGINIPNYDEIRQNDGFKNVSLGNVLSAGGPSKHRIKFLSDEDQELYRKLSSESFEVQVGLHELLGHGSGKLLMEDAKGNLNFAKSLKNPVTGERVASWYKPGQTWGSQFGSIASSWEECRAEAVGLYLCTDPEVQAIFGHEGQEAKDIAYINWLSMARAGLAALPFYNPKTGNWGQAHMQARFALFSVMLEAGKGFITLDKDSEGNDIVRMDRTKIESVGRPAVGAFLRKLNILKATASATAGRALYHHYTKVSKRFIELRKASMKKRRARHIWVQSVTDLDATGKVILRSYPGNYRGVIDSFLDRYGNN